MGLRSGLGASGGIRYAIKDAHGCRPNSSPPFPLLLLFVLHALTSSVQRPLPRSSGAVQNRDSDAPGVEQENEQKEFLLSELEEMASLLKNEALGINKILEKDNETLERLGDVAGSNVEKVGREHKRMGKKSNKDLVVMCGSFMTMAIVALVFFVTVVFMRVFPK